MAVYKTLVPRLPFLGPTILNQVTLRALYGRLQNVGTPVTVFRSHDIELGNAEGSFMVVYKALVPRLPFLGPTILNQATLRALYGRLQNVGTPVTVFRSHDIEPSNAEGSSWSSTKRWYPGYRF